MLTLCYQNINLVLNWMKSCYFWTGRIIKANFGLFVVGFFTMKKLLPSRQCLIYKLINLYSIYQNMCQSNINYKSLTKTKRPENILCFTREFYDFYDLNTLFLLNWNRLFELCPHLKIFRSLLGRRTSWLSWRKYLSLYNAFGRHLMALRHLKGFVLRKSPMSFANYL